MKKAEIQVGHVYSKDVYFDRLYRKVIEIDLDVKYLPVKINQKGEWEAINEEQYCYLSTFASWAKRDVTNKQI